MLIDDKQVGVAPYSDSRLRPGEHLVRAILTNHEPFQTKVNIKSGVADQLKISLKLSKAYTDSLENARIESQRNRRRFSSILGNRGFCGLWNNLFAVENRPVNEKLLLVLMLCASSLAQTVTVPAGTFVMGDKNGESDERLEHPVTLLHLRLIDLRSQRRNMIPV